MTEGMNQPVRDTILFLEFGSTTHPLELVISETKPGTPEEIRKHLEALSLRSGLFVYVPDENTILTAEEYLTGEVKARQVRKPAEPA